MSMRCHPDKWELAVTGYSKHTRHVDTPVPSGYDSERAARQGFRRMRENDNVTYTTAVIYPPVSLGQEPIYLIPPLH